MEVQRHAGYWRGFLGFSLSHSLTLLVGRRVYTVCPEMILPRHTFPHLQLIYSVKHYTLTYSLTSHSVSLHWSPFQPCYFILSSSL
jgi:hypothetical protein